MALIPIPNIWGRKYNWPLSAEFYWVPSAMGQWVEPHSVTMTPKCTFHGWGDSFGKQVSGWADATEGID